MRKCPGCGARMRGADLLCQLCSDHLPAAVRARLGKCWREWSKQGSLAAMQEYEGAAALAIRAAQRWQLDHLAQPPVV